MRNEAGSTAEPKSRNQPHDVDLFNLEELLMLFKLATKYEEEKWLRVCSRFFDKTGKRLSVQQAKERVEAGGL